MTHSPIPSVLVVEDDLDLRQTIGESLEAQGFAAAQAVDATDALERLRAFAYDALVVDLNLPDANGMEVLDEAVARYPQIRAVVITGFGGVSEAVQAMKQRRDRVPDQAVPAGAARRASSRAPSTSCGCARRTPSCGHSCATASDSTTSSAATARCSTLFSTLELVAPMNSTVLIQGETGTGKELIARTIHHHSPRADQRFVAFNAAAIPETLAEAELFGHVKGAFTGAVATRVGRFELAHRGTLFIDEVASMSLPLQTKLLRALQEREVERLGESKPMKVDIRVIAATNTDLRKLVKDGTFREDLYYRLNVIPVTLPPLRDAPRGHPAPGAALRQEVLPARTASRTSRSDRRRCAC